MPIIIREIVSEVVLERGEPGSGAAGQMPEKGAEMDTVDMDKIVRRATERVLETLRREWDR